jgi:phage shock protein PspC (stress-responsive transcriptional regulator)
MPISGVIRLGGCASPGKGSSNALLKLEKPGWHEFCSTGRNRAEILPFTTGAMIMTIHAQPLTASKDNLLGICNAVGEDFGFNPLWLRLALGAVFVVQPVGVVVAYLALGLVVLASRLLVPNRATRVTGGSTTVHQVRADNEGDAVLLAEAA